VTLAGAFASYYWTMNKSDLIAFPVSLSLWRALRYHLGSIAFGSLIIAIIQIIRVMLEYVEAKLKGYDNKFVKFLIKALKCCFWCLEKFMKFINKNAYIMVALYGSNFCSSAKKAFFLLMRNIIRVVVIDKVTDLLLLISKLVVVGIVGVVAFEIFSGDAESIIPISKITAFKTNFTPELNYYLIPVIIIVIGTYVIASSFFNVYNMGVDTIFLCLLEDEERNDGSAEKPYYMSSDMKSILSKKNKAD
jgi:choline transporter-like protein 2/4/5